MDFGDPFAVPAVISGTSFLKLHWSFVIATDKQQVDRIGKNGLGASIFPVMFALYKSLLGYGQKLKAIAYNGEYPVHKVETGEPFISIDNSRQQQGLVGWTATWPYVVWMKLNTLTNLATPVS